MRKALFITAGVLLIVALALWYAHRWQREKVAETSDDDPSATFASPYLNVRPGVKYVGDEACSECHVAETESYRRHPMGRAFAPMSALAAKMPYGQKSHNPFDEFGFHFVVDRQGERVLHREQRKDSRGTVIAELDVEAQWALGSGSHGCSYLFSREGRVFQSPISWFTQKQVWHISPGYSPTLHGDRVIAAECLFCHCNYADAVPHTINQFREPIFHGYAIGCERCHGPGELHVESRQGGKVIDGEDHTIVNPARLPPALRESVCQQCHLQGDAARVLRRGRQVFDFRPGLPLHHFWSVYVRRPGFAENEKAVSHVQQMYSSRCFRASQGELGCISCHDPHAFPAPEQKESFYRSRCLQCHRETDCGLTVARRREKSPKDNCLTCHMPPFNSSDIAHTALTNHRIPRTPEADAEPAERPILRRGESPVLHFHQDILDLPQAERDRDLALAYVDLCRRHPQARPLFIASGINLLESAVKAHPDDLFALEGQAMLFSFQGQNEEALANYEAVLAQVPYRESALSGAAYDAEALGRAEDAIAYWRRALAVNPVNARYHYVLGSFLADRRDWPGAIKECEAVLRLNPFTVEARRVLVACLIRFGDRVRARTEFEKLSACSPEDQQAALYEWYSEQLR